MVCGISYREMPRQSNRHLASIVGANIRAARNAAGLTQRELGQLIGVEGMFISRWERGANSPSPRYLPVLADVLFEGDISAMYVEPAKEAV